MGRTVRDGEHVGFELALMDAAPLAPVSNSATVADAGLAVLNQICVRTGRKPQTLEPAIRDTIAQVAVV